MRQLKTTLILVFTLLIIICSQAQSQGPGEPPPPPGGHGTDDNQSPRGAPVGSGLMLLMTLAGAYGVRKYYTLKKNVRKGKRENTIRQK